MIGFYKSSCKEIHCIEKFRCCKMEKRNFYFVDLHTQITNYKLDVLYAITYILKSNNYDFENYLYKHF